MKILRYKSGVCLYLIFICQYSFGQISVDFERDSLSNIIEFASKVGEPMYFPKLDRIYLSENKKFACVINSKNPYDSIVKYKLFDSDGKLISEFYGVQLSNCLILPDGCLVIWGNPFSEEPIAQRFLVVYSKAGKINYKHDVPFNFDMQVMPIDTGKRIVYFGSNLGCTEFSVYLLNSKYKIVAKKTIDMHYSKGKVYFDEIAKDEIIFILKDESRTMEKIKLNFNAKW